MKSRNQDLESYLARISQGDSTCREAFIRRLSEDYLFVPVTSRTSELEKLGKERVSIPTLNDDEADYLPAFTSEEHLLSWSHRRYQCLIFPAADLALSLPRDRSLVINPGFKYAAVLTRSEVDELAASDWAPENIHLPSELEDDSLLLELHVALRSYGEVEIAYYKEHDTKFSKAALGLVAKELSQASRFLLLAEAAEISKKHLGEAGALLVLDDLDQGDSDSWVIFDGLSPFYVQETAKKKESALREGVEMVRTESKPIVSSVAPVAPVAPAASEKAFQDSRKER